MTRIAIHPQTLDLKKFEPGKGLQKEGYLVFKDASELVDKGKAILPQLATRVMGRKREFKSSLKMATMIWPDLVIKALHGQQLDNVEDAEPKKKREEKPKGERKGRGNHGSRLPDFELTGEKPSIRLPTQAEVLCLEFNKLHMAGWREVSITKAKTLVEAMKLPTTQDPMRIFRYYFWLCVRAGVLKVEGETKVDQVVKQNADRHGFEPSVQTAASELSDQIDM